MFSKTTRFEKLLEAVPDALVGMDQKGVIRFVNHQTESLFGYDRDDLIGQPIETLVPEPLWQIYAEHREGYFADPRTRSSGLDVELRGRQRDGTEFPANISLSHIDTGDVLLVITAVRDVAKQKQAVKNAQLIASIVEYSDNAIIGSTLDGIAMSWNPAAERMYGYSSKEMVGKSGSLLAPQGRTGEIYALLARIKAGEVVEHFETNRVRKDGTVVPVSITVAPIRDEDGTIVGASAVHRDVTEQRKAFESAQRIAALIEHSDDAIFGRTPDCGITSWNPAAERMYGYSSEEIIGKSAEFLIPGDRTGEIEPFLARIKAGQPVEHLETKRVRKDGTVFPVSLTISPIRDEDGATVGTSVIARDMTEQRKAFESAQRTEAMVEFSAEAIIGAAPDGTITSWNPAAERMFGYSSEEITGKSVVSLAPEGEAKLIRAVQSRMQAGGDAEMFVTALSRKDGTAMAVWLTISPIRDSDGTVVGASVTAHDVTNERKAFEAAQRIAAIVESSDDAILSGTLDGIITSWNPAAERLFGYSSEEFIGKPARLLTPEDRAGEIKAVLAKIKAGQHIKHLETKRVRKDGTVFPVSLTASPIRDADGAIVGTSVIYRDVTKEREAFEAAQRIAAIVEYSDDAINSSTLDGIVTSWNPAAERMYGYSSQELVGKSIQPVCPADRAGEIKAILAKVSAGQPVEHLETVRVRKDGTKFPVSLTISPICDPHGAIVGVSTIARDMTEHMLALAAAQRMAAIVENSDDAILSGSLDGIITSWNPAAERMFGYSSEEIVGKPARLLTPEDRAGEVITILARISAGHAVAHLETKRVRKDGTVFPISLTVSPIRDADGAIVGTSVIHRDMTELKHAAQYARSLIEAGLDPLVTVSSEGKIKDVNDATVKVTGVPRNKLIGTDFSHYFTEPDKANEGYRQAFAQGSVTDYPLTMRHRDGTLTDVLCNASVYRDAYGNVLGVCAAARDMTTQKKAFEAAQRIAAIVEYSNDAIISGTLEGIITSWNPAAERLYGYTSEEIIGKPTKLMTPDDGTGEMDAILARIKAGEAVEHFETNRVRKDGTAIRVSLTVSPICDPGGAIVGASTIAREVTEQK